MRPTRTLVKSNHKISYCGHVAGITGKKQNEKVMNVTDQCYHDVFYGQKIKRCIFAICIYYRDSNI